MGGSLVGPLLDFGRAEALVDQAEARQRQALITYRQTIQTAFREVIDALEGMRRAEERLQATAGLARLRNARLNEGNARLNEPRLCGICQATWCSF